MCKDVNITVREMTAEEKAGRLSARGRRTRDLHASQFNRIKHDHRRGERQGRRGKIDHRLTLLAVSLQP
jgi:hypothetical protein